MERIDTGSDTESILSLDKTVLRCIYVNPFPPKTDIRQIIELVILFLLSFCIGISLYKIMTFTTK
jgi:hypothetical protein